MLERQRMRPRKGKVPTPERKVVTKPSYAASVEDNCVVCKTAKHPLYGCKVFYGFPHTRKMTIVRDNGLCLNCLQPGHFAKQCRSVRKCQKPHHSWIIVNTLDKEAKVPNVASWCKENSGVIATHTSQLSGSRQILLMTCQVQVTSPDGHTTKARVLLDSASSA